MSEKTGRLPVSGSLSAVKKVKIMLAFFRRECYTNKA